MSNEKSMTDCVGCVSAVWRQTANGRLHPDGTGRCVFELPDSPLPLWLLGAYGVGTRTTVREALSGHRNIFRFHYNHNGAVPRCGCRQSKGSA